MSPGDDPRADLAARQAGLVAALVAGGPAPAGLDTHRVEVAARALLRKRAREVAHHWPALLATAGTRAAFTAWARARPSTGAFRDGWDFAEHRAGEGRLDAAAAAELEQVRAAWRRAADGSPVRRRRVRLWAAPPARRRRGR